MHVYSISHVVPLCPAGWWARRASYTPRTVADSIFLRDEQVKSFERAMRGRQEQIDAVPI